MWTKLTYSLKINRKMTKAFLLGYFALLVLAVLCLTVKNGAFSIFLATGIAAAIFSVYAFYNKLGRANNQRSIARAKQE